MINVYKSGGDWKREDGTEYTVKSIPLNKKKEYIAEGWLPSLSQIEAKKKRSTKKVEK
jgi:hypothetical protein